MCVVALEFRFLDIPDELGVAAGFSMYDWESWDDDDDEMIFLFIFVLDDI